MATARRTIHSTEWLIGDAARKYSVQWDEISIVSRPERISPWEIEPFVALVSLNPLPAVQSKRPRANTLPVSPDFSILGSSQASSDSMQVPTFTRVLQGQEARTLGSGDNDAENTHSSMMWRSKLEDQQTI
ncbi:auxin response factor 2B-like [Cryptomeria japonica]|uniref:auxin response factor 2B-like n=1 Tax=Cryptomeria japonica TaxID=3369 RepID=UPI0025AC10E3|nr:auxin response factor 2B-like [Cryptomeria japonica]